MKIEQLKNEVSDISTSLNNLKNDVKLSEEEKKKQAEALKTKVDETKKKIDDRIKELSDKTDEASKKELEEGKQLLETLENVANLQREIIEGKKAPEKAATGTTGGEVATGDGGGTSGEKKGEDGRGVIGKSWDWIKEQWNETTRDNLKKKPGATLLRGVGFAATGVGAVALAYKGIKKLFGRGKEKLSKVWSDYKEKKSSDKDKSEKKESFWKSTWGNVLKWAGITTAAGGGLYGLSKWIGGKKENTGSTDSTGTNNSSERLDNQRETAEKGGDKISDGMLDQLLKMEGSQNFVAHKMPQFGEKFVTGPYGMVYKHIDENGNLLKSPISFKDGERVTETWAKNNARAHYDKCAKGRKKSLDEKGLSYNQNELDSLVSASGGTAASKKKLESYVFSHWSDKNSIFNFMSTFATTAAGNGKVMPGLVSRRKFEANWFIGNKQPFSTYQKRRK